jgi:hypothetical protein
MGLSHILTLLVLHVAMFGISLHVISDVRKLESPPQPSLTEVHKWNCMHWHYIRHSSSV